MNITVKKLKKLLEDYKDTDIIVMSKDGEGNNFSPLAELTEALYIPNSTWDGDTCPREITDNMREHGFSDEDLHEDGIKALILWPTN